MTMVNDSDYPECEHEHVESERSEDGLSIVGYCLDCEQSLTLTGPEDDEGRPGWEVADRYTPGELVTIYNQTGEDVKRG